MTTPATPTADMLAALLPCPFCGGEPTIYNSGAINCENSRCPMVVCQFFTSEQWNTRAEPHPHPQGVGDAEKIHAALYDLVKAYSIVQEHYGLNPASSPVLVVAKESLTLLSGKGF